MYVRNSNTAQDKITSKQTRTTSLVVKAVNYYLGDTTTITTYHIDSGNDLATTVVALIHSRITTYHFHIQDYH